MVFQGIRTSIAKNSYNLCEFSRWSGPPATHPPPSGSAHVIFKAKQAKRFSLFFSAHKPDLHVKHEELEHVILVGKQNLH